MVAITSNGGGTSDTIIVAAGTTSVTTVVATDGDPATPLTYSIVGGVDADKFTINATTGELSFVSSPVYDAPTDVGGNNVYDVQIGVAESGAAPSSHPAATMTVERLLTSSSATSDVQYPIKVATAPGDADRLYVLDRQQGELQTYDLTTGLLEETPFLKLPPELFLVGSAFGNHIAFSVAFDPNYEVSRKLFVSFIDVNQKLRVVEFTAPATGDGPVDTSTYRNVITIDYGPLLSGGRHYGGDIDFGPDGYLYLTTGDNYNIPADATGDVTAGIKSQNLDSLEGKVLRIDPFNDAFLLDANNNFTPAAGNPFDAPGSPVSIYDAIWATGLRNPFQASFGPDGKYYLTDVGQSRIEEINLGVAGANYGWPIKEGTLPFPIGTTLPGGITFTDPLFEYSHTPGDFTGSVSGGVVYTGPIASMQGQYFFGDYVTSQIWSFKIDAATGKPTDFVAWDLESGGALPGGILSFATAPNGDLLVVSASGIFRVVAAPGVPVHPSDVQNLAVVVTNNSIGITITGTEGFDRFAASYSRPFEFRTTLFNDTVYGLGGNDGIDGGLGADIMYGGLGSDTYRVENEDDQAIELLDEGTDTVSASIDWTLGAHLEILKLRDLAIVGTGNELDNQIVGNSKNNELFGMDGDDSLDGGAGSDVMTGGAGSDNYYVDTLAGPGAAGDVVIENASGGTDKVIASVNWILGANFENLTLTGSAISGRGNSLNNYIKGNALANQLYGFEGTDTLDGLEGGDTMDGGGGNDTYVVDDAEDFVIELLTGGVDRVLTTATHTLAENVENLTLKASVAVDGNGIDGTGNGLNNTITGNADGNVLSGLGGVDRINGGEGNDVHIGGAGNDIINGGADPAGDDNDIGVFSGNFGNYLIVHKTDGSLDVTDQRGGSPDGFDKLTEVETLRFSNGTYDVATSVFSLNNAPPTTTPVALTAMAEDSGNRIITQAQLLANAADINGDMLTAINLSINSGAGVLVNNGNGTWSFTPALNDNSAVTFSYVVTDGLAQVATTATLDITPVNDAAVISGNLTGSVTEDGGATQTVNGVLSVTDVDGAAQQAFQSGNIAGLYGQLTLTPAGAWQYVLNNVNATVQALNSGSTLTDTITVRSIDGTASAVAITIHGADELSGVSLTGTGLSDVFGPALSRPIGLRTSALNDIVFGLGGNDSIDGGLGADQMHGGAGNDTYRVDNTGDQAIELAAAGFDTVASVIDWTLAVNLERLILNGTATNGTGNALDNQIVGNSAHNVLAGKGGKDTLTGAAGPDTFVFDAPSANVDTVTDFNVVDDVLQFSSSDYGGVSTASLVVTNGAVAVGGAAQFVFNAATTVLSWDANGSFAGGQVAIAKLTGVAALSVNDFEII